MRTGRWLATQFAALWLVLGLAAGNGNVFAQRVSDVDDDLRDRVGDERLPTGRLIDPAGITQTMEGRPVDLTLAAEGRLLFVKDRQHVRVFDPQSLELLHSLELPGGASLFGIVAANEGTVYVTNAASQLFPVQTELAVQGTPLSELGSSYRLGAAIELPEDSFPCGLALSADESELYVCLSKKNALAIVARDSGEFTQIDVGVAPFAVAVDERQGRLFVSNLGGRRPLDDDRTAPSAGTEVVVDERGIARTGSVSVITLDAREVVREVPVGLQPSALLYDPQRKMLVVANSNDDSLSLIQTETWEKSEVVVKPDAKLPFGSMPSALAYDPAQQRLFVALAGNNAVAVVDWQEADAPAINGFVPTGWYPGGLTLTPGALFVSNVKGLGSRAIRREPAEGRNSHDHLGSVQRVERGEKLNEQLPQLTARVKEKGRVPQILRAELSREGLAAAAEEQVEPRAFPEKLGHPSKIEHIIYVIKENRTYDQVFGDFEEGRGAPELCLFPAEITPNHHALAERFGLLDNYYCNGVLSADGHSWATEGNVTPYLERAFGGFARSYTFGDDPLTYSSSGFIWDHVLGAGLSFRNYGEMDYATPPEGMKYQEIWEAYQAGERIEFEQNIGIEKLRRYSSRDYPGWNMVIPDVLRMDRFLEEFREFEEDGGLPNLSIVYLPQDHLGGGVTSQAHMADNDLAIGRLVEAVSNSSYWQKTAIFINEDDPQNGFDHIDGHRSICLVVSPYSKPGVNNHFYNQTSVLRTILYLLGLPPMNQQDASAPLMEECFQEGGDFRPYAALPATVPLNQTAAAPAQQSPEEIAWRKILSTVPIERTGMKTEQDEDNLNRFIWHEVKGWKTPYPEDWAGAHGRGLSSLGLVLDPDAEED